MIETLIEAYSYSFMQRAALVMFVTALCTGLLSAWIILIGWSLLGDAISHSVLPGVVIAYIVGLPFSVGALLSALATVALIGTVKETTKLKDDTSIGIVFTTFFALGVVLVTKTPSNTDLHHILFGNVLGIRQEVMIQVLVIAVVTTIFMFIRRRDITLWAFDSGHAKALGVNRRLMHASMLVTLALVIVASMQAIGVILVVAMLITPGASAFLMTQKMHNMLWIAPLFSIITAMVGLSVSYLIDVSSGGMVVVTQGLTFAVIWLVTQGIDRKRKVENARSEGRAEEEIKSAGAYS